jgi:hypothetical protein
MSYLFIKKICFKEKSLYYFHKKFKVKKPKKTFFVGWLFLVGYFGWVFFTANPASTGTVRRGRPAVVRTT